MLTLIILVALVFSFYLGFRRGVILQGIRLVGYLVTWLLSTKFYQPLSEYVELIVPFPAIQPSTQLVFYNEATSFMIDRAFYRVITFLLISLIGWLVTNLLSTLLQRVSFYPLFDSFNRIGGGVLNALITYVIIFLVLFMLSLIPIEWIQQQFVNNPLAYWMTSQTPILADYATKAWLSLN